MPKFCANLSYLFADVPLIERVGAARMAGFPAVEILFPYDGDAAALRHALSVHQLTLALINCPPPNYVEPGGPRGFAAVPEEAGRFRIAFRRALRYARTLGAERVHVMSGTAEGADAEACLIDNLAWAVGEAGDLPLTIEPINLHDMPGYFLHDYDTAARVLDAVGAPTLGLQLDIYHATRIAGDALAVWTEHGDRVRHIQFADVPGRGAPGTGHIDFDAIWARLDADGYAGWVSAEYKPAGSTQEELGWLQKG